MTILPARSCIIIAFGAAPIACQNRRAPLEPPMGFVIENHPRFRKTLESLSIQGRRFRCAAQARKRALRLRVVPIPDAPRPDVHAKCGIADTPAENPLVSPQLAYLFARTTPATSA